METTFKQTLKGTLMDDMFEAQHEEFSVKYYSLVNDEPDFDIEKSYMYEIRIRHPEETNGKKLFNDALKKMINKQHTLEAL
jgi:hypothetical protein